MFSADRNPDRKKPFDIRTLMDATIDQDLRPVTYHEIGSGRWRTAPRWMPGSVRAETYQLDGAATPGSPGRLRAGEPRAEGAGDVYPVPVAGLCTRSASQWTAGLGAGIPCTSDRTDDETDAARYLTEPLQRKLELSGQKRQTAASRKARGLASV